MLKLAIRYNQHLMKITKKAVMKALSTVLDPELNIDIVSLGLIYDVRKTGKQENGIEGVHILMTLTTPGCPLAPMIDQMVREAISTQLGVDEENISLEITFDPPWTQDMMSEEVREELGF